MRSEAGAISGRAGGQRRVDLERTSLTALAAALTDLGPGVRVDLQTASSLLLAVPARLAAAEAGNDPPTENLDLWAQASTALRRVELVIRRADRALGSPTVFAAAWADLACDRAKDKGAFTALIPKPNLANAGI